MRLPYHWLGLAGIIIVLDQLTKYLAAAHLGFGQPVPLAPLFNLSLAYNEGAAFSFLSDSGGWQRWFFAVLSTLVSMVLVIWLSRLPSGEKWTALALSLILGGAVGNLIDRVFHGYVIDFIDFYYRAGGDCIPLFHKATVNTCHFPTFNVADSAITVGAAILIAISLFDSRKP
ncbi:MAG TPA: signal peptidase II [Gammaproteobacteria bacterium]